MQVQRVLVTDEAKKIIDRLRKQYGPLMFHQSGGCCDGSQPMCFEKGEFKVGGSDVRSEKCMAAIFYEQRLVRILEAYPVDLRCYTRPRLQLFPGDSLRTIVHCTFQVI